MQIAPTALISFSISTNVTALQACYGFTMGWVINFCELHIRHLIMPFINKCHPRYLLGEVNKLNVQLSALCKSILTPHCIFSLVCLSRRMTMEIAMANKGIWGTIICAQKQCFTQRQPHCWWQEPVPLPPHVSLLPGDRAAEVTLPTPWTGEENSRSAPQILHFQGICQPFISTYRCLQTCPSERFSHPLPQSAFKASTADVMPTQLPLAFMLIDSWGNLEVCVFPFPPKTSEKAGGWEWTQWLVCHGPWQRWRHLWLPQGHGGRTRPAPGYFGGHSVPQEQNNDYRRMKLLHIVWSVPGFGKR